MSKREVDGGQLHHVAEVQHMVCTVEWHCEGAVRRVHLCRHNTWATVEVEHMVCPVDSQHATHPNNIHSHCPHSSHICHFT